MGKPLPLEILSVFGKRIFIAALACILVSSCTSVVPVLTNAAINFGRDLLAVASHNVSPQYASDIERLLVALLQEQTGVKLPPGQSQYGYGSNTQEPYGSGGGTQDQYGYGSTTQDPYGSGGSGRDQYGYGSTTQDPYGSGGSARDQYGYGSTTQDPYGTGGSARDQYGFGSTTQDPYGSGGGSQDQYGYAASVQDPYGSGSGARDPYGTSSSPRNQYQQRYRSIQAPISMDVALLAQEIRTDGSVTLESIQDGTVLHDGRGNPEAGDKLKVSFSTNCDCYVYVIGIDATGFVAQIFPDPDSSIGNPVSADRQYTFPEGDVWWGLDDYRGVETVYFIASHTRRTDIEEIISSMANTTRHIPKDYKTVQVAAVIPDTRGLVKVHAAQASTVITESGSTYEFTPTAFTSAVSGVDLVITRWFSHQ